MISSESFLKLLGEHDPHDFDRQEGTIIGTWPDFTLALMNDAWSKFAKENDGDMGAWCLGSCILDAIPKVLLSFFREHFEMVLREDRPWEHTYECSTPDQQRLFHMLVFPLSAGQGLLMIHSIRKTSRRRAATSTSTIDEYEYSDGFFHQCVHCRRMRRTDDINIWDWLPELVRRPRLNTSHGLCQPCYAFYYCDGRDTLPPAISTVDPIDVQGDMT